MFPASTKGGGQCTIFPDVCKTPAPPAPFVPVPYPNIAMCTQCDGCSEKVLIGNKQTIVKGSEITVSSGDEGGTAGGGMISSKFKGPGQYKKGSSKVTAEGKAICHLTSMVGQNGGSNANCPPGLQVAPSQTDVTVAP